MTKRERLIELYEINTRVEAERHEAARLHLVALANEINRTPPHERDRREEAVCFTEGERVFLKQAIGLTQAGNEAAAEGSHHRPDTQLGWALRHLVEHRGSGPAVRRLEIEIREAIREEVRALSERR